MAKKKSKGHHNQDRNDQARPQFQPTGANSQPIVSRLDRISFEVDRDPREDVTEDGSSRPNHDQNFLANFSIQDSSLRDCPSLPSRPSSPHQVLVLSTTTCETNKQDSLATHHVPTVINDYEAQKFSAQIMMNANGNHPPPRHQQPHSQSHNQLQRDRRHHVNDTTGANTPNGPMPSHIQVAKPYIFHQAIEACISDLGVLQAGEDRIRLAGVQWIDNVRKALKLPVRTFETAVIYYHKFRLSHADNEYSFVDAAAAALFAACKIEDTLKKSRDILCAAHNLKLSSRTDHLSPDDPSFEAHSRAIIGLERLMLEASSFDFRNRHPQPLMVKMEKYYGLEKHSAVTKTAHLISLDLYRTFAPLKQNTATMAFACLELSSRLHGQEKEKGMKDICEGRDYKRWSIERETVMGMPSRLTQMKTLLLETYDRTSINITPRRNISTHTQVRGRTMLIPLVIIIETLLDVLELYTLHRPQTIVAPLFNQDIFLDIRIPLNEELGRRRITRYTEFVDTSQLKKKTDTTSYAGAATNGVLPGSTNGPANGRVKASPTSPATPSTPGIRQKAGERGKEGTVRFMLNPDREREEKEIVASYAPLMASIAARR